jgi:hypothetical protein
VLAVSRSFINWFDFINGKRFETNLLLNNYLPKYFN